MFAREPFAVARILRLAMGESVEELYAELADAARALLEAEVACNALLARDHLQSELSQAIGRIVQARDELHALLQIAPRRRV